MTADAHGYAQTLRVFLTQFNDETLFVSSSALGIVAVLFTGYWFYNRKKFHQLGHQIPAAVVKNYLDSIIQNSASIKSALFRGGGLDVDPNSMPAVLPLSGLRGGDSVSTGAGAEEISQKNAQISSLTARLNEKTAQVGQLEGQLSDLNSKLKDAQGKAGSGGGEDPQVPGLKAKIKELEDQLAKAKSAPAAGGGDAGMKAQLDALTKERDALKERLAEYEIIEDDLANLKRLQQENEQLKKSLAGLGGAAPVAAAAVAPAAVAAAAPAADVEPVIEAAAEEPASQVEPLVADAPVSVSGKNAEADKAEAAGGDTGGVPSLDNAEAKSAEDLLNEFEKMLGS